jgi:putative transposase
MELPNRKPTRLANYDYSNQNYYFVTICTHNKLKLFGEIDSGTVKTVPYTNNIKLNSFGEIAKSELLNIPTHFDGIYIDKYVIMPNHIHAIIIIGCDGETERSRPFPTLSTIVGLYKSGVSKRIHKIAPNMKIWQKSFNDRIIQNSQGYLEVCKYIDENSMK